MDSLSEVHPITELSSCSVSVLGSTGSVGRNTVDLLLRDRARFQVEALTAHKNIALLAEQARALNAKYVAIADLDPALYLDLKKSLAGTGIDVGAGPEAISEAASRPVDRVMCSIMGIAGLKAVWSAIRQGGVIGLANKEVLVSAGNLITHQAANNGATLLPVDSEHSAVYQVFNFNRPESVTRIILTASGGPFRNFSMSEIGNVTPAQAIDHPNWDMGSKISVDSATMMNKGLELIEAYHLFPLEEDQIDILVHPQSVVHSMVEYVDGSVLAQLGTPDMRVPIAYALVWPERIKTPGERLKLEELDSLTFEKPDYERFPAPVLARYALKAGGTAPAILNASNEVAVAGFLGGKINFRNITVIVEETLEKIETSPVTSLESIYEVDKEARRYAETLMSKIEKTP